MIYLYMYMYFVVPQMPSPQSDLPSGLILLPEFISEAYEKELLSLIEWDKVAELEQSSATGDKMYLIAFNNLSREWRTKSYICKAILIS